MGGGETTISKKTWKRLRRGEIGECNNFDNANSEMGSVEGSKLILGKEKDSRKKRSMIDSPDADHKSPRSLYVGTVVAWVRHSQ